LNLPIAFGRGKQTVEPLEKFIAACIVLEDPWVLSVAEDYVVKDS